MTTPSTRPNDFEGIMGEKYVKTMRVICPQHEEAKRRLKREIEYRVWNSMVENSRPRTLLDLGCGGAEFIRELNDFQRLKLKFIGIDSSPVMIKKAIQEVQGSYRAYPNSYIKITRADITDYLKAMILLGQTVDIVTTNFVLHNFTNEERAKTLPLIYEAISPGGWLYMNDKIVRTNPQAHARDLRLQYRRIESLAEKGMPELVQPWKNHYAYDESPERKMTEKNLKISLREVGFKEVRVFYRYGMDAVLEARK